MKLLKVHTTSRGIEYRIEIHAYNLVMYRCFSTYQLNNLRELVTNIEFQGTVMVTKDDFT